jgi:hypothetical protein
MIWILRKLIPTAPNWAKKFNKFWVLGKNNAQNLLSEFVDRVILKNMQPIEIFVV